MLKYKLLKEFMHLSDFSSYLNFVLRPELFIVK